MTIKEYATLIALSYVDGVVERIYDQEIDDSAIGDFTIADIEDSIHLDEKSIIEQIIENIDWEVILERVTDRTR